MDKKKPIYVIVSILLIILVILAIRSYILYGDLKNTFNFESKGISLISQYSEQAITILRKYKNYDISSKEAYEQIEKISKQVDKEYEKIKKADDDNSTNWLILHSTLHSISWDLLGDNNSLSSDVLTISEIEEYIDKLHKIK